MQKVKGRNENEDNATTLAEGKRIIRESCEHLGTDKLDNLDDTNS